MIKKITHLTLYVLDQNKAYDIYVNKLGCKVHTDMPMDNGFRWLTVTPPDQPELEIVLAEPKPPMFGEEQTKAVRTLLEQHALGGGRVRGELRTAFRENEAVAGGLHDRIPGQQQEDVQREQQRGETLAGAHVGEDGQRALQDILLRFTKHPEDGQRVV